MRVPEDMPRPRRRARRPARSGRGRVVLVVAAIALFVLITSLRGIASFYTDYLWFDSLGQGSVFRGVLGAKAALALIFIGLFFVLLWINLWVADRIAPRFRPAGPEEELVERYHELVGERTGLVRIGVSLLFALIAGAGVSGQWNQWLLFINRVDFGETDPLFHRDIGFYVFQLPFLTFVVDWLFAAFVIILIVTAVAHYLNGGIRVNTPFQRVTPQVKAHLSVLLALLALIKAGDYWLRQFELTTSSRGTVDGALYTDVNTQLPAIRLLLLISLFAFVLFIVNINRRGWVLPVLAVGLWAFVSVVAGGIVPAIIQRFRVEPDELAKESQYIERNIDATKEALGLEIESVPFAEGEVGTVTDDELASHADTINNIRLWDPSGAVLGESYQRLQELRAFYEVHDVDVDRYEIGGQTRQVMIATRELNTSGVRQTSWAARHLQFTHGYGVVMSTANVRDEQGQPVLAIGGIPVSNDSGIDLNDEGLRIYVGEDQGAYVIVNSTRDEVDFQNAQGDSETTRYDGEDGVGVGSWLRRAAFALRFGDFNPLFSGGITGESRILYLRDVRERVETLAPFLAFDDDPYPVLLDGRIVWVLDAFTTTSRYPYAEQADVANLPGDSGLRRNMNYVRNSVKAVVDAYDGTVTLYVVDDDDPIARAYKRAFPSLFADEEPSRDLQSHFRYPQDLFFVQTNMWGRYHQDDVDAFFNNTDTWVVAKAPGTETVRGTTTTSGTQDPTLPAAESDRVDPVYALIDLPGGEEGLEFVLTRPFVPAPRQGREPQQLTAFMAAGSDPDRYGELQVFEMDTPLPDGPGIVANTISSDPDVAQLQTLLGIQGGGSDLIFGNLVMVPLGDSLLYVRPVYVQAEGSDAIPLLQKVIVEYQRRVSVADTLREALDGIFGEIPAIIEGDVAGDDGEPPGTPTDEEPEEPTEQTISQLLADAESLFTEAQAALEAGDLGEYQSLIEEARDKVSEAARLVEAQTGGTTPGEGTTTTTSEPPESTTTTATA